MEHQAVLDFWFGAPATQTRRGEWFRKDEAFDAVIQERFTPLIDRALAGEIDAWRASPESAVARILVLDQFTRNAYRGRPRAFAGDVQALAGARELVAEEQDRKLPGLQRWFVYMPFEHAEDLAAQDEALRLFSALGADHPELADVHEWAEKHRAVVARFGRFPHRNAILGRTSTVDEDAFLRQPGSSF